MGSCCFAEDVKLLLCAKEVEALKWQHTPCLLPRANSGDASAIWRAQTSVGALALKVLTRPAGNHLDATEAACWVRWPCVSWEW